MKFRHLHSTKEREPYGLFVLLVQLDFTIGDSLKMTNIKNTKNLTEEQQKEMEGKSIMQLIKPSDYVVLLDERGSEFRSIEFAKWLQKKQMATKRLLFIVGGAYGFSNNIYERANEKISLSRMTFSHQMIRLFFVEQLYRAFTILRNEPYHHQ